MTAYRIKTFRDLSQHGTRTVLVVFAIAVGLAGFLAVLSTYAVLTREMNRSYLATNPASATLRMDKVDDTLIAAVLSNPAIGDAQARRVVRGRIKAEAGDSVNLRLFVVKDFGDIRISKWEPERGAWPPATGEVLIERDALGVAHARIGDTVSIRTAEGKETSLRVSGSVHDIGLAQARMDNIVYGYITQNTLTQLGEAPYLNQLKIAVSSDKFDEKRIRRVAEEIKNLAESRGYAVHHVDVPTPGKHPHAQIMGLLLLVISGFGFCILALSGVLVVNLVTAMLALQVRQIGVMKATGANQGQIASIYFGQALIIGTAAIVIALPLGIWGGHELVSVMAVLLNFDIVSFAAPVWVYVLAVAAGWIVPLLPAAYPIWHGSRIPVRVALAEFGVSSDAFGTSRFDRALAGFGGPLRPLLLALRNSFRQRTRLALTLATLVAGGVFFMTGLNVRASMMQTIDRSFAFRKFDLSVILAEAYPLEQIERVLRNTPGILRAEEWTVSEAVIPKTGGATEEEHFTAVGLPGTTKLLKQEITAGRGLLPGDTNAIVLNSALAGAQGMLAGGSVVVRIGSAQAALRIVGIARERFSPPLGYIPLEFINQLGGHIGAANSIQIALDRSDRASVNRVKNGLEEKFRQEHMRTEASVSTADSRFGLDQHMLMIYVFLIVVSSIIATVGGLGLMTTMSLNVLERRREIGVLRAIGATPPVVWLIVVTEGIVVGVLSWALAALAACPLSEALDKLLEIRVFRGGFDFRFDPAGLVIWLIGSLALGAVASLLPAWNASRMTVREALSHG